MEYKFCLLYKLEKNGCIELSFEKYYDDENSNIVIIDKGDELKYEKIILKFKNLSKEELSNLRDILKEIVTNSDDCEKLIFYKRDNILIRFMRIVDLPRVKCVFSFQEISYDSIKDYLDIEGE